MVQILIHHAVQLSTTDERFIGATFDSAGGLVLADDKLLYFSSMVRDKYC
jgi:hypothetical protein